MHMCGCESRVLTDDLEKQVRRGFCKMVKAVQKYRSVMSSDVNDGNKIHKKIWLFRENKHNDLAVILKKREIST